MFLEGDVATRTERRQHLSDTVRIERLEEDNDEFAQMVKELVMRIDKLNGILVGLLISIVAGTVVMVFTTIINNR